MRMDGTLKEKIYAKKKKENSRLKLILYKGQAEKEPPKKHEIGRRYRREAKGLRFQGGSD